MGASHAGFAAAGSGERYSASIPAQKLTRSKGCADAGADASAELTSLVTCFDEHAPNHADRQRRITRLFLIYPKVSNG